MDVGSLPQTGGGSRAALGTTDESAVTVAAFGAESRRIASNQRSGQARGGPNVRPSGRSSAQTAADSQANAPPKTLEGYKFVQQNGGEGYIPYGLSIATPRQGDGFFNTLRGFVGWNPRRVPFLPMPNPEPPTKPLTAENKNQINGIRTKVVELIGKLQASGHKISYSDIRERLESSNPALMVGTLTIEPRSPKPTNTELHDCYCFISQIVAQFTDSSPDRTVPVDLIRNVVDNQYGVPLKIERTDASYGNDYILGPDPNGPGNLLQFRLSLKRVPPHAMYDILTGGQPFHTNRLTGPQYTLPEPMIQLYNLVESTNLRLQSPGRTDTHTKLIELDLSTDNVSLFIGGVIIARATSKTNPFGQDSPILFKNSEEDISPVIHFVRTIGDLGSQSEEFKQSLMGLDDEVRACVLNLSPDTGGIRFDKPTPGSGVFDLPGVPMVDMSLDQLLARPDGTPFPPAPRWVGTDPYRTNVYNAVMFLKNPRPSDLEGVGKESVSLSF